MSALSDATRSTELHVVAGAGTVGSTLALLLAGQGRRVRVITRSGSGPTHPLIERVPADVTDLAAITAATAGATAVHHCTNPAYSAKEWETQFPLLQGNLIEAAARHGAVLVALENLYGYGPHDGPLTEGLPMAATGRKGAVRARLAGELLDAHRRGKVRATAARASDFIGPLAVDSHLGERVVPKVIAGKSVQVVGNPDMAHTWTYVPDVAMTMAALAMDQRAWGRAWHVPSDATHSAREMVALMARCANAKAGRVSGLPVPVLRVLGIAVPLLRELAEEGYQFDKPFVMDSGAAQRELGLRPTPTAEVIASTVAWFRAQSASKAA